MSSGSERDWWEAAGVPEPYTFSRERLRRKDVWETVDWIESELVRNDLMFRSDVRRRFVNLRSMLATMLPDDPERIECPEDNCNRIFWERGALREHLEYDHRRVLTQG